MIREYPDPDSIDLHWLLHFHPYKLLRKTRDVNRFVVPPKRRLEVNYLTPTLVSYSSL